MAGCGLRISEDLAVNEGNVIEESGLYRVKEQVVREDGEIFLGPLKHRKPGDFRNIPLPDWTREAITEAAQRETHGGGYLVKARREGGYVHNNIRDAWKSAVKKVESLPEDFNPHGLRHCYAAPLLAAGVPLTDVSSWLGHRDVNVTYRTYRHYIPASGERARTTLNAVFGKPSGEAEES